MIKLHSKLKERWEGEPFIVRLQSNPCSVDPTHAAILVNSENGLECHANDFRSAFVRPERNGQYCEPFPVIELPAALDYLSDGDIISVNPNRGEIWVMYRRNGTNAIFATERCNSRCLMCSQPPKEEDDRWLVGRWLEAIPLMDPATVELGITGGEPTLLGKDLLRLIQACREHLPTTALHMLSNGRYFAYVQCCQELAAIEHPDLMIGIPLYSDIARLHDFVVQAPGSFDQTIRGIMNLKRCGVGVEIRVVLHRQTIDRLPQLARFIARNLPMVDHVALMGLEMMGYVRMNLEALWVDPFHYQSQLVEATSILTEAEMLVSIYNHQLCVLDQSLWHLARKSISDWKNEYRPECDNCDVKADCGGFFASSWIRSSDFIRPVQFLEQPT